jgi:hypothetical protein
MMSLVPTRIAGECGPGEWMTSEETRAQLDELEYFTGRTLR